MKLSLTTSQGVPVLVRTALRPLKPSSTRVLRRSGRFVVATLAGMGACGAIGGAIGALIGLGIPEYQAKRYEGRMRKGGILLSVHADDQKWASTGKQILEQTGAEDISSTGETKGDYDNSDRPTARQHVAVAVAKH